MYNKFVRFLVRIFTKAQRKPSKRNIIEFPALKEEIKCLSKRAYVTEKSLDEANFLLEYKHLLSAETNAEAVGIMLRHAERVAPGLNVPRMIPHVIVRDHSGIAGKFIVEDGWVTITVGTDFFIDKAAAYAILAHEICHYILENSGLRKPAELENERYTDLCMYVCGFGLLFSAGYKRSKKGGDYRADHHLGYLTDAEYRYAAYYVNFLRQSNVICLPDAIESLHQEIARLIPDKFARERIISHERKKQPDWADERIYAELLERLKYERR